MLSAIGADSIDDLFREIPRELLLDDPLDIPSLPEDEIEGRFRRIAAENRLWPRGRCFLGAGAYRHFIPSAAHYLVSRGEFMTCYTPYQAEVSQGTLQVIFEFQSHICSLTGMDVANASMYDGATALAEALTLAIREKRVDRVYLPEWLHPDYRAVCGTFLRGLGVEILTVPASGSVTDYSATDIQPASAVVVATPNCLGSIEDGNAAREFADRAGALLVACCNPTSLAMLAPPSEYGADIAVGEAQPLGIPLSFGGPYAGYFACRENLMRKMPGRLVGRTRDKDGREGFVLTLQTREQHIRRDKATSNICTNQGLFALMATVYLTLIGRQGLVEVAETSALRAHQLASSMVENGLARVWDPQAAHFHEVVLELPINAESFRQGMKDHFQILAGFALANWFPKLENAKNLLLVNCTELNKPGDIEAYIQGATEVVGALSTAAARTSPTR